MTIRRLALAFTILLAVTFVAAAQERPLSPPDRPPVPLTDLDLQQPKASVPETPKPNDTQTVKVPTGAHSRHMSSGSLAIDALVYEAAGKYGLDPCLIIAVMKTESAFSGRAVSPKGASGLMQLMPETAARFGVRDIFDQRENVMAGASYLKWLLDRFGGDVRLALAGYNAGEGAVEAYGLRIPPYLETQNYVRTIYTTYSSFHMKSLAEALSPKTAPTPGTSPPEGPSYNQILRFGSPDVASKTTNPR
jgi:soluble lytic murein transglycosylase-like protein